MNEGPIPLRAHEVLCLLGFRGRGYSPAFIEAMQEVRAALRTDPAATVRLLASPDRLCKACPHLASDGCRLRGPGHERHMAAQDRAVSARLGLAPGAVVPWREIVAGIRDRIRSEDLAAICGDCPWLELGWCEEGIDALRGGPGTDGLSPT